MNLAPSSQSIYLSSLPNEVFLMATTEKLERRNGYSSIRNFCNVGSTCSSLNNKVKECWLLFVDRIGNSSLLLPPQHSTETNDKAILCVQKQYRVLKNWENITFPEIENRVLQGEHHQCVVKGNLLWLVPHAKKSLVCINLLTNRQLSLDIAEELDDICYKHKPCMVALDNWLAICTQKTRHGKKEVTVLDTKTGNIALRITPPGTIGRILFDDEFLYVMYKDNGNSNKLLRYDSNEWNKIPIEFPVISSPNIDILDFDIGSNELIFSVHLKQSHRYQFLVVQKNNFLTRSLSLFLETNPVIERPTMRVSEGRIILMSPISLEYSSTKFERLYIEDSTLKSDCFLNIPHLWTEIDDFRIQLDKIFILYRQGKMSIFSFDLEKQKLVLTTCLNEDVYPAVKSTDFEPQLISPAIGRIQLLYNSTQITPRHAVKTTSLTICYDRV